MHAMKLWHRNSRLNACEPKAVEATLGPLNVEIEYILIQSGQHSTCTAFVRVQEVFTCFNNKLVRQTPLNLMKNASKSRLKWIKFIKNQLKMKWFG